MTRIACLHTAESNVAVFDAALSKLGLASVELRHHVRADLLDAAAHAGGLTPAIMAQTAEALRGLCDEADAVLLTCSTLGAAAELATNTTSIPVMRVDAALAREAVKDGGRIAVLCAIETTVEPTKLLFEAAAHATGAEVVVRLVPHAWEAFKAGNRDRYLAMIAQAVDETMRFGATRVALAQASMAGAATLVATGPPLLDSPTVGLAAAIAAASRNRLLASVTAVANNASFNPDALSVGARAAPLVKADHA